MRISDTFFPFRNKPFSLFYPFPFFLLSYEEKEDQTFQWFFFQYCLSLLSPLCGQLKLTIVRPVVYYSLSAQTHIIQLTYVLNNYYTSVFQSGWYHPLGSAKTIHTYQTRSSQKQNTFIVHTTTHNELICNSIFLCIFFQFVGMYSSLGDKEKQFGNHYTTEMFSQTTDGNFMSKSFCGAAFIGYKQLLIAVCHSRYIINQS